MMTPKEQAEKLVNDMLDLLYDNGSLSFKRVLYGRAKLCALRAVDEISKCTKYEKQKFENDRFSEDYWQEVKQEIENHEF